MRVRPLINCIMSEIETFFEFSDLGIDICSISHYLNVLPVFLYQSPYGHYMFFYIIRYRLFRVFSYKSFI